MLTYLLLLVLWLINGGNEMPKIVTRKLRWGAPASGGAFDGFKVYFGPSDTTFDYTQPSVNVGLPVAGEGVYEINLADWPELAALPEGEYDLAVTAFDAAGNESDFAEVENVPLDLVAPGAPTNPEVVAE